MENLTAEKKEQLYLAPIYISLLAASTDEIFDDQEKTAARELAHFRTYSSSALLRPYYKEVEREFNEEFQRMIERYTPLNEEHQEEIKSELEKIYEIIGEIEDKDFRDVLSASLKSYAKHVGTIHRNFIEYFVLPLNIPGLTD